MSGSNSCRRDCCRPGGQQDMYIVATLLVSYSITERTILSAFLCLRDHNLVDLLTPKSAGDYVSASLTSSYPASIFSSPFTLSSTTDASSALFNGHQEQWTEDSGNNVLSFQLKKLYRNISSEENKIKQEDSTEEPTTCRSAGHC